MAGSKGQVPGLCWGSVQGATLLELAEVASAAGLVPLAVTPAQFADAVASGLTARDIRSRLDDLGVRVSVIDPLIRGLPGIPPAAEVLPAMRYLFEHDEEDCWRAAEALEAGTINMTHFLGRPVPVEQVRDALAEQAGRNHAHGFASTIEFIPGTMIPDLATAADMITGSSHLRIMFDTWHFARSGGRPDDLDRLAPGAIGGGQLNDWAPPEPGAPYVPMSGRLLPGHGTLPLADIMARIEANSPGLDICIEVFNADLAALGRQKSVQLMAELSAPLLASA